MMFALWCYLVVIHVAKCQNLAVSSPASLTDISHVTTPSFITTCIDQTGNVAHECVENIDLRPSLSSNRPLQDSLHTRCIMNTTKVTIKNFDMEISFKNNCSEGFFRTVGPSNKTQQLSILDRLPQLDEMTRVAKWYEQHILNPLISIPGILGNIATFIVIIKCGLQKPSNIFILGLAVADTCVLVDNLNFVQFLLFSPGKLPVQYEAWELPHLPFKILWWLDAVLITIADYGLRMSTAITVIITVERCLAVYFPLKFTQLVTPRRAWVTLVCATLFWLPWHAILICTYLPYHAYEPIYNTFVGWHELADNLAVEIADILYVHVTTIFSDTLPLALVTVGTLAIAIKVKLTMRTRKKMATGQKKTSSRTTKTLLMVCAVYSITRITFVLAYIPMFSPRGHKLKLLYRVYRSIRNSLVDINSAANFFIYVFFNPTFRSVFKETFYPVGFQKRKT